MFKNLFNSKNTPLKDINTHEADVVLRLMFEIAISDGNLDAEELNLIKQRASTLTASEIKVTKLIRKIIDETESSVSIYGTVTKINDTYSKEKKLELLQTLWEIVAADNIIDPYEENLYFKIAELIKIRRSAANQIKQKNS
jgi:uncharacterized tellurite resistance protein B-like protein